MGAQAAQIYSIKRQFEEGKVYPRPKKEAEDSAAEEALKVGDLITLDSALEIPQNVKTNRIAKIKWERITGLYIKAGIRFVSTADLETLEQYCLTWSDFDAIVKLKKKLARENKDAIQYLVIANKYKVDEKFINLNTLLIKLSTLLYLNPASRIKHYGQKKKQEEAKNKKEEKIRNLFGD